MQSIRQKYRDEYVDFKNNKEASLTEKLMKLNHVIKNATEMTKFLENFQVWGRKLRNTHLIFYHFASIFTLLSNLWLGLRIKMHPEEMQFQ